MFEKHLEIERRWLLRGLPLSEILSRSMLSTRTTIYVVRDPMLELRIRERTKSDREVDYGVVAKVGSGMTRNETPKIPCGGKLFRYYMVQRKPYLTKEHFEVVDMTTATNGLKWEISLFVEPPNIKGLVLAELEFDDIGAANAFSTDRDLPEWLRSLVIKEVTDDPRYNGKNLAVSGRPNPE
ncbi:MAG: hypothetical protein AAB784_00865 [Patescibacteria group bacterium]